MAKDPWRQRSFAKEAGSQIEYDTKAKEYWEKRKDWGFNLNNGYSFSDADSSQEKQLNLFKGSIQDVSLDGVKV